MDTTIFNVEHDINIHLEDRRVSRHFFVFLFLMYAVVYMTKNCFNGALADIVADGVLTKSQTGLITALFYLAYTPLQIVGGIVVDKYSPELFVKIGLLGGAIANTIIFFNHNYYVMLVVWTLNAIIQFAIWPGIYKIVTSQLCRSDKSFMIFLITMASTVGLLMSYVIAAFLPSWEMNFAVSAAALFALTVAMHLYDKHLNRFMKKDYEPVSVLSGNGSYGGSTFKLFLASGFFVLLIPSIIRCLISQGSQTLAPLMLNETFGIDPSFGNLLNTLIIVSGLCGTFLVKLVLYPRIIKNEIVGVIVSTVFLTGFTALFAFAPSMVIFIIALCGISLFATSGSLFMIYFNATFAKYGKNGAAAGIMNSAASFGIVLLNYGVLRISDVWGWDVVRYLWLALVGVYLLCAFVVLAINNNFRKMEAQNSETINSTGKESKNAQA